MCVGLERATNRTNLAACTQAQQVVHHGYLGYLKMRDHRLAATLCACVQGSSGGCAAHYSAVHKMQHQVCWQPARRFGSYCICRASVCQGEHKLQCAGCQRCAVAAVAQYRDAVVCEGENGKSLVWHTASHKTLRTQRLCCALTRVPSTQAASPESSPACC